MSKSLSYPLLIAFTFFCTSLTGQRLGLLPSSTKWQQLRHDSLRIIYPEGNEETAKRVASLMLKFASVDPITTEGRYKPISILLQPHTNTSNGYVGLAPYVSEFYLQPYEDPFQLGSLPWADLLAIHEYRHVQQVNAVNTGFSHIVKFLFGELAFSAMYELAISNWLREGDAVAMETKWTPQGRGRLSNFTLPFREKARQGETWKYYVLRNGSFQQYVPDHYPLGYLMTMYGNHAFGEATWDTIFRKAPRMKPIYDPFSGVVKKYYGKSNRFLYLDAFKFYGDQYAARQVEDILYPAIPISEKDQENRFFNMTFPDVAGDGSVYCSITTFDSITSIFKIAPNGHREKIVSVGIQTDTYFDHSYHRLVWTEWRTDPRWIRQNKNVIVVYDEISGKKKDIKPIKGYYMPSLDITAKKIVALHTGLTENYNLHILDATTGAIIKELPNEENLYLGYPVFSEDGQHIIATARNKEGRMCLIQQDIETGVLKQISHYSYSVLGRPAIVGPWIFLTCGMGDLDQVYAVDRAEGIFYQVSGGQKAHYHPAWDPLQEVLVCSEYTNNGSKLVRLPGLPRQWRMVNLDDGIKYIPGAEERNLLAEPTTDKDFETKKYSPWSNAINFYGLNLQFDDPEYGLQLQSTDIMNNVSMALGYAYNRNRRDGGPFIDVRLGMWFPIIDFGYSNTSGDKTRSDGVAVRSILNEIYAGVSLPLFFTPGVYRQVLQLSTNYYTGISHIKPKNGDRPTDMNVNYATQSLEFINSRTRAYRQAFPSWAQDLRMSYAHELSGVNISQWYIRADVALPSFKATNYIRLAGEYLSQAVDDASFQIGSNYAGARGFNVSEGGLNYKLGCTYGFPLIYPDIGFGNILYVPRIRFQPFYDIAYSNSPEAVATTMSSAGGELLIDFYFGKLTLGLRYARLLTGYEGSPDKFEIFIPIQRF